MFLFEKALLILKIGEKYVAPLKHKELIASTKLPIYEFFVGSRNL